MDTPDYMNHIAHVARTHDTSCLDAVGNNLTEVWKRFESAAQASVYDILGSWFDTSDMRTLCDLLYRVPDCSHADDVAQIQVKNAEYGGSWHKRGGQGAFMMLARKWDRLEKQVQEAGSFAKAISTDRREEGILDDLGDLRRYLVLVLAWHHAASQPQQAEIQF